MKENRPAVEILVKEAKKLKKKTLLRFFLPHIVAVAVLAVTMIGSSTLHKAGMPNLSCAAMITGVLAILIIGMVTVAIRESKRTDNIDYRNLFRIVAVRVDEERQQVSMIVALQMKKGGKEYCTRLSFNYVDDLEDIIL